MVLATTWVDHHDMSVRRLTTLLAASAALMLAAPAAQAGVITSSAASCDTHVYSKPFANWLDFMNYVPVPGGSFERGDAAWTLSGGAKVVSGNESFYVRSSKDARSLLIPRGATVTSRSVCVGLAEPTLRFFAKQNGGLLGTATANLAVSVEFETQTGLIMTAPIGAAAVSSGWAPTLPMAATANLLPLLPNDTTAVRFKFAAVSGDWQIDDVYVDPMRRG